MLTAPVKQPVSANCGEQVYPACHGTLTQASERMLLLHQATPAHV